MNTSVIKNILHNNHLKATKVRIDVLSVLIDSESALSHHEISRALTEAEVDKVTLYRTLKAFEKKRLIHKVATKDRNWQYAMCVHHDQKLSIDNSHAHFICDKCDKIFCLPGTNKITISGIHYPDNFIITRKELRLHGLCPDCQTN
ncbi:MAG TPA: transcriptional repressor [Balneolales bacterium]|nr:transcriptional repressor [Balneolales bacterium]